MQFSLSTKLTAAAALALSFNVNAQAPANDECAGAIVVVTGSNPGPYSNVGATNSTTAAGAPTPGCVATSFDMDIWFKWTASCSGLATFSTCSMISGDTVMEIYDGTAGCGALTAVGCNDDSCGVRSSVTGAVTAGNTYLIRLDTWSSAGGTLTTFAIDVTCPIPNDECIGALPLTYGLNTGLTNLGATASVPAPLPCSTGGNTVLDAWWSFTATCTAPHTFSMCTSAMTDTVIEVLDGCTTLVSLGCNDDSCGLRSELTVNLTAGQTYLVRAGGWNSSVGNFEIDIQPGTGNGTSALNTASTCSGPAPLTLTVSGNLHIGGTAGLALAGNGPGFPIVAYDFAPPITLLCGCTILDATSSTFTWFINPLSTNIPCNPLLISAVVLVQGFELYISPAGLPCAIGPFDLFATDIFAITIG